MSKHPENETAASAGINRRGLLKCMAWAGTGVVWAVSGGVPRTLGLVGGGLVGGGLTGRRPPPKA